MQRIISGEWLVKSLAVLAVAVLLLCGGCMSTESDLPWNTPQSWEGSTTMPGFGGGEY